MDIPLTLFLSLLFFFGTTIEVYSQGSQLAWETKYLHVPNKTLRSCAPPDPGEYRKKISDIGGLFRRVLRKDERNLGDFFCWAKITSLSLRRTPNKLQDPSDLRVSVSTVADHLDNTPLVFSYETYGGKIIGVGREIIWDLSGVPPGQYAIEVCADDGRGCGNNIKTNRASAQVVVKKVKND